LFFFFFFFFLILLFRLESSLFFPGILNPDEFQIAATGMRLKFGYSWDNIDNITSGPINSIVTSWPYLFGFEITLFFIRFTALVLILIKFILIYKILIKLTNFKNSILLIIPYIIFYLLTSDKNFLHFNTELVPTVLSLILLKLYLEKNLNNFFIFLSGAIVVTIFFTKIQFIFISFFFFFLFLKLYFFKKKILFFFLGYLTFAFIFLIPVIINSKLVDFLYSYIFINLTWTETRGWLNLGKEVANLVIDNKKTFLSEKFFYHIKFNSVIYLVLIYLAILTAIIYRSKKNYYEIIKNCFCWLFLISFLSAILPGRFNFHYFSIFIPFLIIYVSSILKNINLNKNYFFFFFSLIFLIFVFFEKKNYYNKNQIPLYLNQNFFEKSDLYNGLFGTEFNGLLVWGWKPEWYIFSSLMPASREAITINQLRETNFRSYYNQRLLNDFKKSSPGIVVDSVNINSFYITDKSLRIKNLKNSLSDHIVSNYDLVANNNDECAGIYLKKKIYENFKSKNIQIKSIILFSDSFNKQLNTNQIIIPLNDLSVNEELCNNYWLGDNSGKSTLKISLKKREIASKLNILNTSNSLKYDFGTKEVEIKTFTNNKLVEKKKILLNLYPKWTLVDLQHLVPIDRIDLDIISFYGKGAGLNEIQIFK